MFKLNSYQRFIAVMEERKALRLKEQSKEEHFSLEKFSQLISSSDTEQTEVIDRENETINKIDESDFEETDFSIKKRKR